MTEFDIDKMNPEEVAKLFEEAKAFWAKRGTKVIEEYSFTTKSGETKVNPKLAARMQRMAILGYLDLTHTDYHAWAEARNNELEKDIREAKREKRVAEMYPAERFRNDFATARDAAQADTEIHDSPRHVARATAKHFIGRTPDTVAIERLSMIYKDFGADLSLSVGSDIVQEIHQREITNPLGYFRRRLQDIKNEIYPRAKMAAATN